MFVLFFIQFITIHNDVIHTLFKRKRIEESWGSGREKKERQNEIVRITFYRWWLTK